MSIRVLIVDDIAESSDSLSKLLSFEEEIEVVGIAANARDGIAKVGELKPHVVLMDLNLPDMDGISATETIVKQYGTPVIMVTVSAAERDVHAAYEAGAFDYLSAPVNVDALIDAIHRAVRR